MRSSLLFNVKFRKTICCRISVYLDIIQQMRMHKSKVNHHKDITVELSSYLIKFTYILNQLIMDIINVFHGRGSRVTLFDYSLRPSSRHLVEFLVGFHVRLYFRIDYRCFRKNDDV